MKEKWKKIKNYEDYEISSYGNVKSLKKESKKLLKPSKSSSGYLQIILCKNGKTKSYFIHKLVANTFIKNENNYKEINHIDENKLNNCVDNLEWCNRKYNMNYGSVKKRISNAKAIKVAKINKNNEIIEIYNSIKEASLKNNALATNIVKCCKHKKYYKSCNGYKWEYVN